ncbi:hypothetical protein [Streptomyces sp. NPDC051704]|uniref:hypothetical protein n=1 Tax=Streptomyces sp. NPDC051704 TaxID=3365671 RepID=UPI0037B18774
MAHDRETAEDRRTMTTAKKFAHEIVVTGGIFDPADETVDALSGPPVRRHFTIVGMVSGRYRRGIPYMRVPGTVLGQIDDSFSAETGVHYEGCRNRLGTFAPPPWTILGRRLIATLPERQVRSGLDEARKTALAKDGEKAEARPAGGGSEAGRGLRAHGLAHREDDPAARAAPRRSGRDGLRVQRRTGHRPGPAGPRASAARGSGTRPADRRPTRESGTP